MKKVSYKFIFKARYIFVEISKRYDFSLKPFKNTAPNDNVILIINAPELEKTQLTRTDS